MFIKQNESDSLLCMTFERVVSDVTCKLYIVVYRQLIKIARISISILLACIHVKYKIHYYFSKFNSMRIAQHGSVCHYKRKYCHLFVLRACQWPWTALQSGYCSL